MYQEIRSRIRYKIILPFIVLTLLVVLAGALAVIWISAISAQNRFDNLMAQITRVINDSVVEQEQANLDYLQQIIAAAASETNDIPAVADAMAAEDIVGLERALEPFFTIGMRTASVRLDRLIAFDTNGRTLVDMERQQGSETEFERNEPLNLPTRPGSLVARVLVAEEDDIGDKFAGLMFLPTSAQSGRFFFVTVAPIYHNGEVVGGMLLGMRLDVFLQALSQVTQNSIITVYSSDGRALFSSRTRPPLPNEELPIGYVLERNNAAEVSTVIGVPNIRIDTLEALRTPGESDTPSAQDEAVIDGRSYQLSYTPLVIRRVAIGYIGVGLSRDYVIDSIISLRVPVLILATMLVVGIFSTGLYIAHQITRPIEELATTAESVARGDLQKRSAVATADEIGSLSHSFNTMTEYLVQLYGRVLAEASQRAAIVESIADGIVVCGPDGRVLLLNPSARRLLGLRDDSELPERFELLPLAPMPQNQGSNALDQLAALYTTGDTVLRMSEAEVRSVEGQHYGRVYVLRDITTEVKIDRAKTDFISTISHELRTPITSMRTTSDLLLRNIGGELSSEQRNMVVMMNQKLIDITHLINNVIVIANIDSGSMPIVIEPVYLDDVMQSLMFQLQRRARDKNITLQIDIPADLPPMNADSEYLKTVLAQLFDNALTYTKTGSIRLRACVKDSDVRIDVADTGPGIDLELREKIFERFVRGSGQGEGISSQDRGIGLGLAIVRQLVERMGGRVWVISKTGVGSIFSITLPCSNVELSQELQTADSALV
ncbi:MAG: HAMP domain-containing protein [Chloroflexaceae bacterium]|nr:HAMP domain-containing protein [Chloroflexaceae bacterium]